MLTLRALRPSDRDAFLAAVEAFRRSDPDWEFAFHFDPRADFDAYVSMLAAWRLGRQLPLPFVPNSYLVGVVGDRIVGRLSLRHELNDFLRQVGGHIGYGVVASERRKGYATRMLELALPMARRVGLSRVLVTCDDDNLGSVKTIEACHGVLDKVVPVEGEAPKRHYWITVPA
ncbi:MAG: GNAT family N-acetyltransferase [Myxococcales bacterium]|nr:GNAT family N-acetyltransferase [Myxococcales bacterium]MDD9968566.1 GNAT family N-acetyltransferase [Myxococcales bacterium]